MKKNVVLKLFMKIFFSISILLIFGFYTKAQTRTGPSKDCIKVDLNDPGLKSRAGFNNYHIKNCCDYPVKITITYYFEGTKKKTKKLKGSETYFFALERKSGNEFIIEIYAEELPQKKK